MMRLFVRGQANMNSLDHECVKNNILNVIKKNENNILLLMQKHNFNKIDIYFPQSHVQDFQKTDYSHFGLAQVTFFINSNESISRANLDIFSDKLFTLLSPYDCEVFTYYSFVHHFVDKGREAEMSDEEIERLYQSIMQHVSITIDSENINFLSESKGRDSRHPNRK